MAASTWFTDPEDPRIWRSEYSYVRRFGPEAAGAPPAKKACYRWTGSRWSAAATDEYDEPSKRRDAQTSSIADGVLGKEEVVLDLEDPSGPSLRLYKIEGEKEIFKYIKELPLSEAKTYEARNKSTKPKKKSSNTLIAFGSKTEAVSYTHLTLPTICSV